MRKRPRRHYLPRVDAKRVACGKWAAELDTTPGHVGVTCRSCLAMIARFPMVYADNS